MPDYQAIQAQSQSQIQGLCYIPGHQESIITRPGTDGAAFVAMRYFNDEQRVRSGLVIVSTLSTNDLSEAQAQCTQLERQIAQQYQSSPQGMRQILQRKGLKNVAISTLYRQNNGTYEGIFCLQGEQAIVILNREGTLKYQFSTENQTPVKRFKAQLEANDLVIHMHQDIWAQTKSYLTSDHNSPQIHDALNMTAVFNIGLALADTAQSIPQSNLIAIMTVPDPAYELVRTYVEQPELRAILIKKMREEKITSTKINGYIQQLQAEQMAPSPQSIDALDPEFLSYPYSTQNNPIIQNILDLQELNKHNRTLEKRQKLSGIVSYLKELDIDAMSNYFDALILYDDIYNAHKNPSLDHFFGIHHTNSWSTAVKQIRTQALVTLFHAVENCEKLDEKIGLLEWAKEQAIFKLHRNNSVFAGAFGNTASVNLIEKKIRDIKEKNSSAPYLDTSMGSHN